MDDLWAACKSQDLEQILTKLITICQRPNMCSNLNGIMDEMYNVNDTRYQIAVYASIKGCNEVFRGLRNVYIKNALNNPNILKGTEVLCIGYNWYTHECVYREFGDAIVNQVFGRYDNNAIEDMGMRGLLGVTKAISVGYMNYYRVCKGLLKYLGLENIYLILIHLEECVKYSDVETLVYN